MKSLYSIAAPLVLFAASHCRAQWLINEVSFGHSGRLSPPETPGRIPGFTVSGQPQQPELLSNKIILTPIARGNQRSAIWAETSLKRTMWTADVDFRANGPERGGGNLNIWLARYGNHDIGSHSIYTVGKFEGLGLIIDAHGGSGGMVRGFLNYGTVDFASSQNIDKLAFGHCQYSYRNLGRPSQIKLRQTLDAFKVEVDDRPCFETNKVSLPPGYNFGITAATPDNPDSFEIFKLVVTSDSTVSGGQDGGQGHAAAQSPPLRFQQPNHLTGNEHDASAGRFTMSKAQFEDLNNRLQSTTHQMEAIQQAVSQLSQQDEQRHTDTKRAVEGLRSHMAVPHASEELMHRLRELENEVRGMRHDINNKIVAHHESLQGYLHDHQSTLAQVVAKAVPSHGKLLAIFVGTQLVFVAAYAVYKRRKASSPKKYL